MSASNGYCSKDDLTRPHLDEKDLRTTVGGKKLRARQLSWHEVVTLRKAQAAGELTGVAADARIISLSMISPALTEEEANAWIVNGSGGELNEVVYELLVYSGLVTAPDEAAPFRS